MYKYSQSTGKLQQWKAVANGSEIVVTFGEFEGAQQVQTTSATPKNVGRANETTAAQQAVLQVKSLYTDRHDNKHYRSSIEDAMELANNIKIPRKIHNFKDHAHKLPEDVWASVKKDGSRACVINGNLYSKIGRKEDVKVPHLKAALERLGDVTFDAEVYAHGLSLQRIRSAWLKPIKTDKEIIKIANTKRKKGLEKVTTIGDAIDSLKYNPNEDAALLKFHVFDIPVEGMPFEDRVVEMLKFEVILYDLGEVGNFHMVYPQLVTKSQAEVLHKDWVKAGYEGVVYYDPKDMYQFGTRAYTCQKSKYRHSAEARVIAVEPCKNGDGKLVLEASESLENVGFTAMMRVERSDGLKYPRDYDTMLKLVGSWITFNYESLSEKGVPLKPVGMEVRKCDDHGNVLE